VNGGIPERPHEGAAYVRQPARGAKPWARPVKTRQFTRAAHSAWHSHFLHPDDFAETVHRETRRSERSGAPLSIVQYTIGEASIDEPAHFEQLLSILQTSKRETDMLGLIGVDTLAVLCPDTDEEGANGLARKIAPLIADVPVDALTATYPDHLFESMSRGASAGADEHSFIVPSTRSRKVGTYPVKGVLDVVLALAALCLLWPLMLTVAILVKLTSKGPVIFRQQRLGKGGVPFTFYKFRSMVVNTDDRIHREYTAQLIRADNPVNAESGSAGEPRSYKMKSDPRVTWFGKFIRTTSIDELPQLFNVLKGDMSMVGPRPCIPYEAANYEPWHLRRILAAKPGITGVWQVEGRSKVSFSEMVRMDLRYIRDCSLGLDLKIIAMTVVVVIRCDGAT
jgi:lipopolysaccharide/colanic/teichoic acid biosynthesis glycosyltransferase